MRRYYTICFSEKYKRFCCCLERSVAVYCREHLTRHIDICNIVSHIKRIYRLSELSNLKSACTTMEFAPICKLGPGESFAVVFYPQIVVSSEDTIVPNYCTVSIVDASVRLLGQIEFIIRNKLRPLPERPCS